MTVHLRRFLARTVTILSVACLWGCASTPPPPVTYACADGRQFSLAAVPGGAVIEIDRLRFRLRDAAPGTGVHYVCDVLEVRGADDVLRVDLEGRPAYRDCRRLPGAR